MRIGKYEIEAHSATDGNGQWFGSATLTWDEADATYVQQIHFKKALKSAQAAQTHAVEQIQVRVRDGVL